MHYIQRLLILAALLLAGCNSFADSPPTLEDSPTVSPTQVVTATDEPTNTPTEIILQNTSTPTDSPPTPTQITVPLPTESTPLAFPFARPILPPGRVVIDPSYRFGSTQQGVREPHHGVEFLNSQGTPVHAAADGIVLFAGDDYNGSPYSPPGWFAFYGFFVILEHNLQGYDQPVYTVYAHLSEISIETGDNIQAGQPIGLVGYTGAAVGSHLHFEIRFEGIAYADSANPEAWLAPLPGNGSLVGTIRDTQGLSLPIITLKLTPIEASGYTQFTSTYEEPSLGLRPPYYENFVFGNLPPGTYELSFVAYSLEKHIVEIHPGEMSQLEIFVGVSE